MMHFFINSTHVQNNVKLIKNIFLWENETSL